MTYREFYNLISNEELDIDHYLNKDKIIQITLFKKIRTKDLFVPINIENNTTKIQIASNNYTYILK